MIYKIFTRAWNFPIEQVNSGGGIEETRPYIGDTSESLGRHVQIIYIALN
jgi:hypothetical protein